MFRMFKKKRHIFKKEALKLTVCISYMASDLYNITHYPPIMGDVLVVFTVIAVSGLP